MIFKYYLPRGRDSMNTGHISLYIMLNWEGGVDDEHEPEGQPVSCISNSTNDREVLQLKNTGVNKVLTEKEINLLKLIRNIEYGEIKIIIQDKQPIRVEELKKSIKL